jgi:hypothetical protein
MTAAGLPSRADRDPDGRQRIYGRTVMEKMGSRGDTANTRAIHALITEARREKGSTAAARRVVKACRVLGLNMWEVRVVLGILDYCNIETGEPWSPKIEKVWD